MVDPQWPSPFIEPVAVEAWDAWFRWREGTHVHDLSVEDTWQRVADALATVEPAPEQARWRSRFFEQLACWRWLPDARLLAAAGTGQVTWREGALQATVNAGVCVRADASARPQLDFAAVAECAAIAVRALDNAGLYAGLAPVCLHIGIGGLADALALLGLDYDSDAARTQASLLAKAIATGCTEASMQLAIERGPARVDRRAYAVRASLHAAAPALLRGVRRRGLRHAALTATTSQRRVALLANDAADALDPLLGDDHQHVVAAPDGPRVLRSSGYALDRLRHTAAGATARPATLADLSWVSQVRMRAAVQPWMDAPIDYPLLVAGEPAPDDLATLPRDASTYGLRVPAWRSVTLPP